MLEGIEQMTSNHRRLLGGERCVIGKEVAYNLKISRRALHDFRKEVRTPYIQPGRKKPLPEERCGKDVARRVQTRVPGGIVLDDFERNYRL